MAAAILKLEPKPESAVESPSLHLLHATNIVVALAVLSKSTKVKQVLIEMA